MENLSDIFIAGFSISFIIAGISGIAFFYYLYTSEVSKNLVSNHRELKLKRKKFIWLYLVAFASSVLMGCLYVLQYYGEGIVMVPPDLWILPLRWIFLAVIGALNLLLIGFALSSWKHHLGQSFFLVFFWLAFTGFFYWATYAEAEKRKIVWTSFGIFWILVDLVAIPFFPHSLLFHDYKEVRDIVFSEPSIWALMFRPLREKTKESSIKLWSFVFPFLLYLQILIPTIGYIITWFLSDGNQFTDTSNLRATSISNLVFDMIFMGFISSMVLFCLTAQGMTKKWRIIKRLEGGHSLYRV